MRHVFVEDLKTFSLQETPNPTIQSPTDVIVKVTATTICGSDVHVIDGDFGTSWGFPLGHEFVGTIQEVGTDVKTVKVGDRVVASAGVWCGQCDKCRSFQIQSCAQFGIYGTGKIGGGLPGAQAEFVRVPVADNNLAAIPDDVSDAQALTVGDILATGWTAVENAYSENATLVVFGAGPVGLSAIHTALLKNFSQIIAIDVLADRLEVAKKLGAAHVINGATENTAERVMELTNGRGAKAIIDAAGAKASINTWVAVAAPDARISMVGIPSGPVEMPLTMLQLKGVTIWMGLANTARPRMEYLLESIQNKTLDPSPIFTETIEFGKIETALQEFIARKPGLIKPLIVFG
ncbi:Polyketide synthase enoylreductase [Penicillium alfredii]|uniref:Polyketide synthase enoylreductase n=1 Tax=Penicillium alfredii TaxID=1506179 RepID=A0A9W9KGM1_9EURO|nr:Polyketide synthase enoylreductase [Penicillium alfredii]KAJ5105809.1 Polyketide synthase enoylreductase [Penicillium alfredii]